MAVGVFTIQELRRVGGVTTETPLGQDGERFTWTSDRIAPDPVLGGARACPRNAWELSGELRTVRTDYPGAKTPSEQVLGPRHGDFTLSGRWDDRYNFEGYAVFEMRRFEDLCRRGNLCRFSFQGQVFEGIIKTWKFTYRRDWDIGYEFSVSTHDRSDQKETSRSLLTVASPAQLFDEADLVMQALMSAHGRAPISAIDGDLFDEITGDIFGLDLARLALGASLDSFGGGLDIDFRVVDPFKRLATQFRIMAGQAFNLVTALYAIRSDVEMTHRTAMGVLDFEEWSRSLRFHGRVLMGQGSKAARDTEERSEGEAIRVYQPFQGESLYSVSRRFYGTPHAWRLIADRNRLTTFELDGTEWLIIPERGEG